MLLIISATFWSSYCEIRAKPHCGSKYAQFLKHCHKPFIHRFPLVYLCVQRKQHFGVLTVKFLPNQITTHKMAKFENIVTSLRMTVLCYCYSAYNHNYNKILKSDWLSSALISALIGQFDRTVRVMPK